jgi:hypothetical protein
MTSFNIISFKKAISEFQEDSAQFPTQQKSNPLFPSGWACEASGRPSVLRRFYQLNMHPSGRSSVFEKNLESFANTDWEDSLQSSGC